MSVPPATAQYSLYHSTSRYRVVARESGRSGAIYLADDCVDECIRDCVQTDTSGFPTQLLEQECRPICVHKCREETLPQCGPGQKLCRRLNTGQPECCPVSSECCTVFDFVAGTSSHTQCCPAGQVCCHGNGCYVPGEMQCSEHALCSLDQVICGNQCCELGERCDSSLGCVPADSAICQGQVCPPGQVCTPRGCCLPRLATSSDCCISPRGKCGDKCCAPGESCYPGDICCHDERFVSTPQGGRCI